MPESRAGKAERVQDGGDQESIVCGAMADHFL